MERRSIELADTVRAPSEYVLKKYRSYGWTIPSSSIVLPNLVCTDRPLGQCGKRTLIKEIVFFGRLETRKGLWMFCRALDRLKYKLSHYQVTFLGKATFENGMSTAARLVRYSATWPFTVRLLTNFDRAQALAYLKAPARLAIMPSPEDNSPSTIVECLEGGIPFFCMLRKRREKSSSTKTAGKPVSLSPRLTSFAQNCWKYLNVGHSLAMHHSIRFSYKANSLNGLGAYWTPVPGRLVLSRGRLKCRPPS